MYLNDISPNDRFNYIDSLSEKEINKLLPLISPLSVIKNTTHLNRKSKSDNYLISSIKKYLSIFTFIDSFFEHELNYRQHIYLLNDNTIEILAKQENSSYHCTSKQCSNILESMSVLGFIYRFNVAKKFGYQDKGVTQVRLNGWGRSLSEKLELPDQKLYKEIENFWQDKLLENTNKYLELLDLCNNTCRPLDIEKIHSINNSLLIKVVT